MSGQRLGAGPRRLRAETTTLAQDHLGALLTGLRRVEV